MTDWVSLSVALAALFTAAFAGIGYLVQRGQLKAAWAQIKVEEAKIEKLGGLVTAIQGMVETQNEQLVALRGIVETLSHGVDLRQAQLDIQRRDAEVREAQLAWARMNPADKLAVHAGELVDRGGAWLKRRFRRH